MSTYFSFRFLVILRAEGLRAPSLWLAELKASLLQSPFPRKALKRCEAPNVESKSSRSSSLSNEVASGSEDGVKVEGSMS